MDWRLALEAERAALKRIVALLFALADLAERASGRSRAVRDFVLWLLFQAEAVAQELVIGTPEPVCRTGNSAEDAMQLARNFRDLAAALLALYSQALSCPNEPDGLPERIGVLIRLGRIATLAEAGAAAFRAPKWVPHDTS